MTITAEATRMREATGVGACQEPIERWDVVVIGAGLAGMYDLLRHMRDKGLTRVEATPAAEREWTAHVHETAARLLLMQVDSWMTGVNKNVAGRHKRPFMAYAGGAPKYRQKCDEVVALRYEGFALK